LQLLLLIGLPSIPALFFLSEAIIRVLCGDAYQSAAIVLQICASLPLVVALSHLLGIQTLVAAGKEKVLIAIVAATLLVGFILITWLTKEFSFKGTAMAVMLAESLFFVLSVITVRKNIQISWQPGFFLLVLICFVLSGLSVYLLAKSDMPDLIKLIVAGLALIAIVSLLLFFVMPGLLKERKVV
jgi:O-antigen/teichoic acid export membrane protein